MAHDCASSLVSHNHAKSFIKNQPTLSFISQHHSALYVALKSVAYVTVTDSVNPFNYNSCSNCTDALGALEHPSTFIVAIASSLSHKNPVSRYGVQF